MIIHKNDSHSVERLIVSLRVFKNRCSNWVLNFNISVTYPTGPLENWASSRFSYYYPSPGIVSEDWVTGVTL